MFNEKAWANEKRILYWLKTSYRNASAYSLEDNEPRLLALDAFRAHMTDNIQAEMVKLNISGSYICQGHAQLAGETDMGALAAQNR